VSRGAGTIFVFTFKEGLLAGAAHDLRLRFERFTCELTGETLRVSVDLGSLRVDGPVRAGLVRTDEYDPGRRADIEQRAREQVLRAGRWPTAEFTGTAVAQRDGFAVNGRLALAGREAPLAFTAKREIDGTHRCSFELQPSRWGIAPYTAMLGTIRLQDRVRIEIALSEAA
jgi:polyisoprenoid-binding protein YceI